MSKPNDKTNSSAGPSFAEADGSVPDWFELAQDDPTQGGHIWGRRANWKWVTCLRCMLIRRADKQNGPCRGESQLRQPEPAIAPNAEVSDPATKTP